MTKITDKLIDKHRGDWVDDCWWEFVYDDFKDDMAEKGLDVDLKKTYFGKMYCQGQGAGMTACVDTRKFMEAHGLVEKYPHIMMMLEAGGDIASIVQGRDYHSVIEIDTFDRLEDLLDTRIPIIGLAVEDWDRALEEEVDAFEGDLREIVDDYNHDLMSRLITEYEYLTSDEYVREMLEEYGVEDEDLDEWDEAA